MPMTLNKGIWADVPVGAAFVNDTFTDGGAPLNLEDHTGETGATWAYHPNYTGAAAQFVINASGRVRCTEGLVAAYASGVPSSANYSVFAEGFYVGDPSFQRFDVIGRANTTTSHWYGFEYYFTDSEVRLTKNVAGSLSIIGTLTPVGPLVASDTLDLELRMSGGTISGWYRVNGGSWTLSDSVPDSDISAAGRAGIFTPSFGGANLGLEFTRVYAQ